MAVCEIYKAGTFNFPASTGNFSVTGLGFEPQAVIFFGGNRSEIDTHVTGATGPGLFFSLNGLDYTNPSSITSLCLFLNGTSISTGYIGYGAIQSPTGCIRMCTDSTDPTSIDYRASTLTFDSDGFTINVTHTPSGVRPIHWFAWGSAGGETLQTATVRENINSLSQPFNAGFDAYSTLTTMTKVNSGSTFGEGAVGGQTWMSFGSGHFPQFEPNDANWGYSNVYNNIIYGTSIGNQGFVDRFIDFNDQRVTSSVGPVFVDGIRNFHIGFVGDFDDWYNTGGGEGNSYYEAIYWNQESWRYDVGNLPTLGNSSVFSATDYIQEFGAVLFASIDGLNALAAYFPQRFGFGILTDDYQGCVVFGEDGSFYQSTSKCLANVNSTTLAAVEGSFGAGTFILDGLESSFGAYNIAIGFSCPRSGWLPQMYRRWPY